MTIFDECNNGRHKFVKIFESPCGDEESVVVRWCKDCGAITVDHDCNGETIQGFHSPLRLPEMAKFELDGDL